MVLLGFLLVIVTAVFLFMMIHPVFGKKPSKQEVNKYETIKNYKDGVFTNQIETVMTTDLRSMLPVLKEFLSGNPNRQPKKAIPISSFQLPEEANQETRVTWFGHSALLIEMDGKRILIDPMFGSAPSPVPWFGNKRYSKVLPFKIEELPQVDLVVLSHDHYDHLDYGTIKKLKHKVKNFAVPLGVAGHLKRWGVEPDRIKECNWWDEIQFSGISLVCSPARHFSGRSISDRNSTLWCSWIIQGKDSNIYFSGDSGYGPHFKEIGKRYGPFDLTLMECGQYHEKWAVIHMMPEETVQAHLDVSGKVMLPIHWGAFTLSLHDWTDPVERAVNAATLSNVQICTPQIGETVTLGSEILSSSTWWRENKNR
ncbi:MBL fold metallo-hydrolase [Fictibacillus sp. 18YEL24]|uniref:MBL fold metallo-hydrolase n=1 Tax=Fictibacillus sp. 18YEL24 TaxID=2745875 RepID=UPI0018CD49B1|nr:MBL fold metallo-hydrolase [Fictibacillus sp. 18YEL24]MBH0170303.1 MBL fold metallo-hydrolase [Fictibacillus sp. 18YEL24]